MWSHIKPSGAETIIFQTNRVKTMATDILVPCVARSSANILCRINRFLVSMRKDFKYMRHYSVEKMQIYLYFLK